MLLAIEVVFFLFFVAGTHGVIVPLARPTTTDFVSFYAAGSLADSGDPQLAYNQAEHYAAEQQATKPDIEYNFFYYPPVFLILCSALARLPYLLAFTVFEATTLGLYLVVATRILGVGRGNPIPLAPLLAFPPVLWNIGLGQNAFLTAALFGAATLLVDRRPILSGVLFGALCYKPHFGLLVPVALATGRHWRAFAAALASAAALCALSLILFGPQTWHDFLVAAAASHSVYESGRVTLSAYITPFGAVRVLGGSSALAYAVQAVATLSAAVLVAIVWRRGLPLPMRAAMLASATLVAVPLALFYDLMVAALAGIWLLSATGKYRLPDWGKAALIVLFIFTLDPRAIAAAVHIPIGSVVALALLGLVTFVAFGGSQSSEAKAIV
jgi:Glycosyltransferase family 87